MMAPEVLSRVLAEEGAGVDIVGLGMGVMLLLLITELLLGWLGLCLDLS